MHNSNCWVGLLDTPLVPTGVETVAVDFDEGDKFNDDTYLEDVEDVDSPETSEAVVELAKQPCRSFIQVSIE